MADKTFYIEQLQDPNYNPFGTIQFIMNEEKTQIGKDYIDEDLIFAITDDFKFGADAQWDTVDSQSGANLQQTLDKRIAQASLAGAGIGGIIESFLGKNKVTDMLDGAAQKRVKPMALSYLSWVASKTENFSFKIYKFAVRPEDDVLRPFKILFRMVLPTFAGGGLVNTPGGYVPPMKDGVEEFINIFKDGWKSIEGALKGEAVRHKFHDVGKAPAGTVTVRIGNWCTIRGLLVTNLSFTASKVCTRLGNPLYAMGSISLQPYRMWIYDDVDAMITTHNASYPYGTKNSDYDSDIPPELFKHTILTKGNYDVGIGSKIG